MSAADYTAALTSASGPDPYNRLQALVERLWGAPSGLGLRVTTGPRPAGHRLVEEYAVFPSLATPRFLIPLTPGDPFTAVDQVFGPHFVSNSARSTAAARALRALWRSRVGRGLVTDRLRVWAPEGQAPRTLLTYLGQELEVPGIRAVIGISPPMPNSKPTARLIRPDGELIGYLKVGWSTPTRELVANEAHTLGALGGGVPGLETPRLLHGGDLGGHTVMVSSPLPPGMTAVTDPPESAIWRLRAVHESGDGGSRPARNSSYAATLRGRIEASTYADPELAVGMLGWLAETLRATETPLSFGRWHGDYVPWNLGTRGGETFAWDWEYSTRDRPWGFDHLHWHFQSTLARTDLTNAVSEVRRRMPGLAALGLPAETRGQTCDLYLLEILSRALRLAAQGAGWNPKIRSAIDQVVAHRGHLV